MKKIFLCYNVYYIVGELPSVNQSAANFARYFLYRHSTSTTSPPRLTLVHGNYKVSYVENAPEIPPDDPVDPVKPITKSTTIQPTITSEVRDLLIIVDSSGSIGSSSFKGAKEDLASMLDLLCPNPDPFFRDSSAFYNQAALIEFSDDVLEIFDFDDKADTSEVKSGIESMKYLMSNTCTAKAFRYARDTMFTSGKGLSYKKHSLIHYIESLDS